MASQKNKIGLPGDPPFFQNPNAEKLIVFVHGLTGDPVKTWSSDGDTSFFWPEQLADDAGFDNADVLSFGYKSKCGPTFNIREIAQSLELTLNQLLKTKSYQSLSFIAHSLGGLVVREFILSRNKHLIKPVPVTSVITLGTPNLGSGLAKFASYFCGNIQMDDLKPGRKGFLDSLNERWRERFHQNDSERTFRFSAGYEISSVSKLLGRIVEKDSAVYFAQQTQGFLKDHSHIAKPYGESDPLFLWVRQQLLKKAPDPRVPLYDDAEVKRLETIIDQMQKELAGTNLEEALNLISQGKLDEALTLLSRNEAKEDEQVLKIAKTRFAKAQVYELKFDYKNALEYYETAARLAPENPQYQNEAGVMAFTLGQYDKAIEYYGKADANWRKNLGDAHPNVAAAWNNLGDAWRAKGKYDKAIEYLEKAVANWRKNLGDVHPKVATAWNNLGVAWASKGNYGKAIDYYEKALAIDLKILGPDHPKVAIRWNNLGMAWNAKGEYDKAIEYYKQALASDLKTFGLDHPQVAIRWNNLGEAWRKKGEYDKAIQYYKKALASDLKTFGPDHPQVAIYWNNLGLAWYAKGEHDKAIEYYEKALASDLATFGPKHPSVARIWNNLGAAGYDKGEYDKAIEYIEKALTIDVATFGPEHPEVAMDWNNLGEAWRKKGQYDKAIEYFEKALTINVATFGPDHPDVALHLYNLGKAWYNKGDYDKAIGFFEKALAIVKKMGLAHRVALVEKNLKEVRRKKDEQ